MSHDPWLLTWARTRLGVLLPVALALALATGTESLALRSAAAFILLAGLRLWDDIASVDEDRQRKPERVLCRVPLRGPRWTAFGFLVLGGALAEPLMALSLVAAAGLFYAAKPGGLLGAHLLLLKYPALVVVAGAGGATAPLLLAIWGAFGLYELLHDPRRRRAEWAGLWFALDAAACATGLALVVTNLL